MVYAYRLLKVCSLSKAVELLFNYEYPLNHNPHCQKKPVI